MVESDAETSVQMQECRFPMEQLNSMTWLIKVCGKMAVSSKIHTPSLRCLLFEFCTLQAKFIMMTSPGS